VGFVMSTSMGRETNNDGWEPKKFQKVINFTFWLVLMFVICTSTKRFDGWTNNNEMGGLLGAK